MNATVDLAECRFRQLGLMRDVLELTGRIRQIQAPITSTDGLRQTIELVLHFADLLGVSSEFTDRLRQILTDENVFQIVLGIVRFLLGDGGVEASDGKLRAAFADGSSTVIEPQDFLSWLPIVVQIINLIRIIRGALPNT
jgi:hypothetical protein